MDRIHFNSAGAVRTRRFCILCSTYHDIRLACAEVDKAEEKAADPPADTKPDAA